MKTFDKDDFTAIAALLHERDRLRQRAADKRRHIAAAQRELKENTDAIAEIQRRLLNWGYTGS